ncbi:PREDICTED: basic salivary proline-rich protein 4-like [Cyprinodon variegatus]|uniref:basic salivary proline-rich protein 4-like n=1 Tax=Cyprinodon variegatus TaxID=28743 RepID=UPI000742BA38|nr:PREDICTED: basic salivary proline-rich protein 4-like [Cyprinodon variegatus]
MPAPRGAAGMSPLAPPAAGHPSVGPGTGHRHLHGTERNAQPGPTRICHEPAARDKQAAEREPHRQRTAGTWGSERPRQKQHQKADMDEPTAPTKPPGGFPHQKTQQNHSTPTDHSKHSRNAKQRTEQQSHPSRASESGTSSKNKAARPTTPRPCTAHGPPRGGWPHRSWNRPKPRTTRPPATKHQATLTLHFQTAPAHDAPHCAPPAPVPTKRSHTPTQGLSQRGPTTPATSPQPPKPGTNTRGTPRHPAEPKHPAPQKNRCPAPSPTQQQHSFHPATDPRARPAS